MPRMKKRTATALVLLLVVVSADGVLVWRRSRYRDETERLRSSMTELERKRADAIVAAEQDEDALAMQLIRRQASGEQAIHLAVSAESSFVALENGTARLRVIAARIGAEARVGVAPDTLRVTVPRGARTIARVLAGTDTMTFPGWVWTQQNLPVPAERTGAGWAGADAIVTTGGTLIYARPSAGPLADSAFVLPGAVRIPAADLAAIRASISPGTTVYFY